MDTQPIRSNPASHRTVGSVLVGAHVNLWWWDSDSERPTKALVKAATSYGILTEEPKVNGVVTRFHPWHTIGTLEVVA